MTYTKTPTVLIGPDSHRHIRHSFVTFKTQRILGDVFRSPIWQTRANIGEQLYLQKRFFESYKDLSNCSDEAIMPPDSSHVDKGLISGARIAQW